MCIRDRCNAIATPVGLLVLLLAFDWRLGLLSLAPVVLAFLIMATMTGKRMAEKMRQYGNALEAMSNEAVEYVRGIPVVKTCLLYTSSAGCLRSHTRGIPQSNSCYFRAFV